MLLQKDEFLVTMTIRKIDSSWWYNACKKCIKTAKRHEDLYKCTNPSCGVVGIPTQRSDVSHTVSYVMHFDTCKTFTAS